jgi:hypothetical protein
VVPVERRALLGVTACVAADFSPAEQLMPTGQIVRYIPPTEYAAGIEKERANLTAIAKALNIQPSP